MYAKGFIEPKYQFLIKKHKDAGVKYSNDLKAFIELKQCMDDAYNNINDCNPKRNRKILTGFNIIITDIMTKQKGAIIRSRKLNISLVFITQFYFSFPKEVRLNSSHYLIIKIHFKRKLIIQKTLIIKGLYIRFHEYL